MRHEDAGLALWVASDQAARDRSIACEELLEAAKVAEAVPSRSLRQRAGAAFIALGERLVGRHGPHRVAGSSVGDWPSHASSGATNRGGCRSVHAATTRPALITSAGLRFAFPVSKR